MTESNNKHAALEALCAHAKHMILSGDYKKCYQMVCTVMSRYPNSPHPHNLMGILYEKEGCHTEAMKHFRAALALDPTYMPAKQNLNLYGTCDFPHRCAFLEADCTQEHDTSSTKSSGFTFRRLL